MAGIDSFPTGSGFTINNPDFKANREKISRSQIPAGIRSAVQDRINIDPTAGATNFIKLQQLQYLTQENTGRLFVGDLDPATTASVLSPFRSVQQKNYSEQQDPSSRYLEVAFSPQNQLNDDIVNQIGYFNIGEFIGDARHFYNNDNKYPDLDKLRDAYFTKYTKSYDLVDFIRLIKFFDNSLFRMIKDFTPANVSLTSGVVVKQHILERNRHKATKVTQADYSTLSGSIPVETFSGGTGGVLDRYQESPEQFNLTQSWSEIVQTLQGPTTKTHTDEAEFYNGEFTVPIKVSASGVDCGRFTNPRYEEVKYKPIFVTTSDYTEDDFIRIETVPERGTILLWHDGRQVKHIKISNTSLNNIDITNTIDNEEDFSIFLNNPSTQIPAPGVTIKLLPSGLYTWPILSIKSYDPYTYIKNFEDESPFIIYSEDVDNINFNLTATGDFIFDAKNPRASISLTNPSLRTGVSASLPQGFFPATLDYPREQFFRGWNGANYLTDYEVYSTSTASVSDPSDSFRDGGKEVSTANNNVFQAIYPASTEPWFMNASASFSRQTSFTDLAPVVRPPKSIVAVMLTPQFNCSTLDINNSSGVVIGIDYDLHIDKFATGSSGALVLKAEANGDVITEDLELYNPNGTSVVWHPNSIVTPATANTNVPAESYGVFRLSTQSNDRIILDIGTRSGRSFVQQINYCPTP